MDALYDQEIGSESIYGKRTDGLGRRVASGINRLEPHFLLSPQGSRKEGGGRGEGLLLSVSPEPL
jgi:hypothetical protein